MSSIWTRGYFGVRFRVGNCRRAFPLKFRYVVLLLMERCCGRVRIAHRPRMYRLPPDEHPARGLNPEPSPANPEALNLKIRLKTLKPEPTWTCRLWGSSFLSCVANPFSICPQPSIISNSARGLTNVLEEPGRILLKSAN